MLLNHPLCINLFFSRLSPRSEITIAVTNVGSHEGALGRCLLLLTHIAYIQSHFPALVFPCSEIAVAVADVKSHEGALGLAQCECPVQTEALL